MHQDLHSLRLVIVMRRAITVSVILVLILQKEVLPPPNPQPDNEPDHLLDDTNPNNWDQDGGISNNSVMRFLERFELQEQHGGAETENGWKAGRSL